MRRFIRFLVLNLAGLGVAGWMQWSLADLDSVKTRLATAGWRSVGGPVHK